MKTYKFPQFNAELIDPQIIHLQWTDGYGANSMPVMAILQTPDGSKYGTDIGTFDYSEKGTYEDSDVMAWAIVELEKYAI